MRLADILAYGPIVAIADEHGLMVTRNGAYLNLWVDRSGGPNSRKPEEWENVDARACECDLYQTTVAQAIDEAEVWLAEITGEERGE